MQISMTGVMPSDTSLFVTAPVQNQQVIASESVDVALQVDGEDGLAISIASGTQKLTVRDQHGTLVYQASFAYDTDGTNGKAHLTIPPTALTVGQLVYDVVHVATSDGKVTHLVPPSGIYVAASVY